ncbi:Protein SENSITIVITY TO RED LIGHT REDUCED 1 [Durusdinium trenchii]|uniref:Protein SENSITIVITY TO RED LIGHT REDUCED 1 n=1 Tax=Durusdinium trenchii TaxID=1381693 RepID=A0ABP0P274_9DINO
MKRQKTDSEKTLRQSLDSASDRSIDPRQESGRVKRQISEIEELEKIALKELRRLNRLERDTKVRRDSKSSSVADSAGATSSSASSARPANAEAAAGAVSLDLQDVPGLEDIAEAEEVAQDSFMAKPAKAKNGEFCMRRATPEERAGFDESDLSEWSNIQNLKAVDVVSPTQAREVRRKHPTRILQSRMVRRKKPLPGVGNFKYKSRWCVLGHGDPDTGELWVEPCDGIRLPKGSLIRLVAPIYGLDDSPLNWHLTVVRFLEDLGFNRSLFEPCWFVKRVEGRIEAMVLVEVDDFNIAATEEYMPDLQEKLKARFKFGKWEHQEADFAGRSVKILSDRVIMHQHKYIVEKLAAVKLAVGRRADKTAPLDDEEFEEFRSMLYKVAWLAHQTRPEAAGIVSILSSRLHRATVHDVVCLNKVITHMRQTAQQPLVLHRFDMSKMILIAASDAGGVAGKQVSREVPGEELEDTIQGAFLIFASDNMPSASRKVKVSLLSWRSSKLRRRVASTLAGEALAFNQAISELEWLQVLIRDIVCGDVELTDWTQSLTPFVAVLPDTCKLKGTLDQGLITDAKSLYDTIQKESPSSRQDRRTAIEIAIILNSIKKADTIVRWAPHPRMVADVLTKDDLSRSNGALEEVLRTGESVNDVSDDRGCRCAIKIPRAGLPELMTCKPCLVQMAASEERHLELPEASLLDVPCLRMSGVEGDALCGRGS